MVNGDRRPWPACPRSTGDGKRALGVECKIEKPDELLWDAIKLGQRCDEKPWDHGLEAAALVVETKGAELHDPRVVRWFDAAVVEVDTVEAIGRWPEAWYSLMCGGRGIRPTSLPRRLRLGPGGQFRHAGGGSALCWRLVTADPVAQVDRVAVDVHGWPPQVAIPDEWRRKIDQAAEIEHPIALPHRLTLDPPPDKTIAEIIQDEEGRLWTDAWDARETVPTSFRLSDTDATRYDVRRAKNDTLTFLDPPKGLPEWCSREVPSLSTSSPREIASRARDQMDEIVSRGTTVLIPPDADKRKGTRPGWDGGRYAFMRRVLETDAGRALYGKRQAVIEPVFANTKFNRRIDRFLRRGRAACRSEWRLITATHNLLKLYTAQTAAAGA